MNTLEERAKIMPDLIRECGMDEVLMHDKEAFKYGLKVGLIDSKIIRESLQYYNSKNNYS